MSGGARDSTRSLEEARTSVVRRLRVRRREIEQAIQAYIEEAAAIERDYLHERERVARPPEQLRMETVQRLLADETVDPLALADLEYEIHASWHLGVVAMGAGAEDTVRRLKAGLGRQLLSVSFDGAVWGWLGGRRKLAVTDVERLLAINGTATVALAIGEPGRGIEGWRQTHREAKAALLVALREPRGLVRYADSSLLAAAMRDDTLARWLKGLLTPLRSRADEGMGLFQALRAYLDAECNRSSAAAALGVDRHTVESRLRIAEKLLGRPLRTCLPELDVALRLEELDSGKLIEDVRR
jgi:sugar diacid utilization regulator